MIRTVSLVIALGLLAASTLAGCVGVQGQMPAPPTGPQPTAQQPAASAPTVIASASLSSLALPSPTSTATTAPSTIPSPTAASATAVARPTSQSTAEAVATAFATPAPSPPSSETPGDARQPGPTAPPAADAWQLRTPLIVDSAGGRLYGLAQSEPVNGYPGDYRIEVFAARDGQHIAAFDNGGPFTLDAEAGRPAEVLFVDLGNDGLTMRRTGDGSLVKTIAVPGKVEPYQIPPDPQYDPASGRVLAFRGPSAYAVDPDSGQVAGQIDFDLRPQDNCRQPHDAPLPVNRSFYDPAGRILYVDFVTYSCIPWIGYTNVSYDLAGQREIARGASDAYAGTAAGGRFYAFGWHRFGIGTIWSRRDGRPASSTTGWSSGSGFQVDARRGRLYQSADGALRVFDRADLRLQAVTEQPVEGELAAYDPGTDQLYFAKDGVVRAWPVQQVDLAAQPPPAAAAPPLEPVRLVAPSPGWPGDRTLFGVWAPAWPETACYVFNQSGGLFLRSHDGGATWQEPKAGLAAGCGLMSALAVSPNLGRDRTLLAGVKGNGVFRSQDGGTSWEPAGAGLPHMGVQALGMSPGFATDRTAFASVPDSSLLRSVDGGYSWRRLDSAVPRQFSLSPEFDRDGTLAVAGIQDGQPLLQFSTDRGDRWSAARSPLPGDGAVQLLSLAPAFARWHVLFVLDNQGELYRSGDGGESWQRVLQTQGKPAERAQIVYGPDEEHREVFLLVSGTRQNGEDRQTWGEVFWSVDGGQAWQPLPVMAGTTPTALAISPDFAHDRLLFLGTADGRVVTIQPPAAGSP